MADIFAHSRVYNAHLRGPLKNRKAITLLFAAHAVSSFAQGISMMAIPWYFASVLNRAQFFAQLVAVATFISLFWSLFAGSFIDRYPRKNVFLAINTVGFLYVGVMAMLGRWQAEVPEWGVAAVFVFTFFLYNIHYPALYAFTQEMTDSRDFGRVNATIEVLGQSTSVMSGAIGAMLIAGLDQGTVNLLGLQLHLPFSFEAWKMHEIFLLDGLTYGIGFGILLFLKFDQVRQLTIDAEPLLKRMSNGFAYLRSRPKVWLFGTASYSVFIVLMVEVMLLLAMYVHNHLQAGADVYASAEVYYSLGALAAGFGIRQLTRGMGTVRGILLLMGGAALGFIAAGFTQSVLYFFVFSVVLGLCNAGVRVLRVTWLFNQIPNNIIGRCTSIFHMFNIAGRGLLLTLFSMAWWAENGNVRFAYVVCGVFVLFSMTPIFMYRKTLETM